MTESIRVRYGRVGDSRQPKNTLVTMRKDDVIYFGISRCRMDADRFVKSEGKEKAKFRADIAASNVAGAWTIDGGFTLHKSGLFGQVSVSEIGKLLTYFDNIDTLNKPNYKK